MDLYALKNKLEDELWLIDNSIDFEYKEIVNMESEKKQHSQEIIRKRNEILDEIKLLDTFNCRSYKFNENRYQKYKLLNNENLVHEAIKAKKDAEFAGGLAYVKSIEKYEGMRDEFGWRIQNNIDVLDGVRYYKERNVNELFVEFDPTVYKEIVQLCFDNYEHNEMFEDFYNTLLDGDGLLKFYCIKFEDQVVGGIIFDSLYNIKVLVVKETFRCCGLGTKLIYKVYNEAKQNKKEIKLYALPNKTFHFLLKNNFLKETETKYLFFNIYETRTEEIKPKEIDLEDYDNIIIF